MGNQIQEGFHESDHEEELEVDDNKQNNGQYNNGHGQYLSDPTEDQDENISIYSSQHAMNLYGVTDSGEFQHNAIKRIPKQNKVNKIKEIFKYKKKLGEGASGKVLLAEYKSGKLKGNKCALKELHRKHRVNAQLFLREVVILESLKHDNILELYGVYLDRSSYFIATAYYSGGEFFDRIIKIKKFSEKQALKYIKPILSAVNFMHNKAIVHRDLKPSNMVFDKPGKRGVLKIIDFGTSEIVIDDDLYTAERVGTILYAPPEWKKDRIGLHIKKGDLWSLGVIVYVLMVGRLPFGEWKHIESYNNDLWFPKKLKKKLSHSCIDFILKLLERYPDKRLSAAQALNHPWIGGEGEHQIVEDLGADLKHGLQSVRQDDKISRVIGKVKDGKVGLKDLNDEDKKIVYDHVKDENAVKRYLHHYQNNKGVGNVNYNPQNHNKPQHPQMNISMAMNQQSQQQQQQQNKPIHVINQSNQINYQQIGGYPQHNKHYHHPPIQKPSWQPQAQINNNRQQQNVQQQQPQQQHHQMNGSAMAAHFLPAFDKESKQIMESIHKFIEQDNYVPNANNHQYGNNNDAFWEDEEVDDNNKNSMNEQKQIEPSNEELDETAYHTKLIKTMSQLKRELNDEEAEEEMREMMGEEYYLQHKQEQSINSLQIHQNGHGGHAHNLQHQRKITHKNMGNPLNIQSEADEELDWDPRIVESLMDLGMATRPACVRAVLATDSMGVNQAAVWLMDHQNDANINQKVDVL